MMYVKDDICYADGEPLLKIISFSIEKNRMLLLKFSNGEIRRFDVSTLKDPVFLPLKEDKIFNSLTLEFGTLTWNNGNIDIASEYVFEHSEKI